MRHQSLLSLLFVMFAVLASFAHAASETGADQSADLNPPYATTLVLHMIEVQAAHSVGGHAHHHGAGDHSQADAQVAVEAVRPNDSRQSWWGKRGAGGCFALCRTFERPPRA